MKKILLAVVFIVLLFPGCGKIPSDFTAPTKWDVGIYLPLLEEEYGILELFDDADSINIDSNSVPGMFEIVTDTFWRKDPVSNLVEDLVKLDSSNLDIPPVSGTMPVFIPFKNGTSIDTAYFIDGYIEITVSNGTSGTMDFQIVFPGAHTILGNQFTIAETVAAGKTEEHLYPLNDIAYSSRNYPDNKNSIKAEVTVDYENTDGAANVFFDMGGTRVSYAEGIIKQTEPKFSSESIAVELDSNIREYADNITFLQPTLNLQASYKANHSHFYDILLEENTFSGRNNSGDSIIIRDSDGQIALRKMYIRNGRFDTLLTSQNSNIEDFINFYPDYLSLRSLININPEEKFGIIAEHDTINIMAILSLGNRIKIENLTYRDTVDVDIDEDFKTELARADSLILYFTVENSMQLAPEIKIDFMNSIYEILLSKATVFEASDTASPDDYKTSKVQIALTGDEISLFEDTDYLRLSVLLNTAGQDGSMGLHTRDSIKISSKCTLKFPIDLEN